MKRRKSILLAIILTLIVCISQFYKVDSKYEQQVKVRESYREYYNTYSDRGNQLGEIDNYDIQYYYDIPVYKCKEMCMWYYGNNTYFLQFNSNLEDSVKNEIIKSQVSASVIRELVVFAGTKYIETRFSKDNT